MAGISLRPDPRVNGFVQYLMAWCQVVHGRRRAGRRHRRVRFVMFYLCLPLCLLVLAGLLLFGYPDSLPSIPHQVVGL